ncbi:type II toxin-antitoxin system VapC family toxin [Nocardia salmonicida]|uniref:type II toxin-antitoxin system VapC family toxin n=1 Tax=Nocardia salmonicida TaxID=53431 RepID=UPI0007A47E4F|nr:type II toxin-antitoxin system VapC family toxin [Nocardia salmonicida]
MTLSIVLDSDGLSALCEPKPPARLRALPAEAKARAAEVLVPAVVCAEVCRGVARTRRVETLVSRKPHDHPWQRPVAIVPTDFDMARLVDAILHGAQVGSRYLSDAHVVALCSRYGGGLVITSDPDDIRQLAAAVPSARIIVRTPD